MSTPIDWRATTRRLEKALRYLATHPDAKVGKVAEKFAVESKAVWAWLTQFNGGRRILAERIVDNQLAAPAPKPVSVAKGARLARVKLAAADPARRKSEPAPPASASLPAIAGPDGHLGSWLTAQGIEFKAINSFQVMVTPQLAAQWLTLNQGNRNPSKAKIRRFSVAMKSGKWSLNGETIKFSATGRLLDGQSRLRAIVEGDTSASLEIRGGLPDHAQQSMDIGEVRKGTHMLEMMGEKYPAILSPALRLVYRQEFGSMITRRDGTDTKSSAVLENMEIGPLLEKHPGLKASVGWCVSAGYRIKQLMALSEAAFFHYTFGRANSERRDSFFTALSTGLGLTATHPAYHLRERLQADRTSTKRMGTRERLALVIKAWNAHYAGDKLGMLVFRTTGTTAESFPEIAGIPGGSKS